MFLSSQCRRDDSRITSQVPLTDTGDDGMGGDGGGSVWLGEVEDTLLSAINFISGSDISVNSGCNIAQWHGGYITKKELRKSRVQR